MKYKEEYKMKEPITLHQDSGRNCIKRSVRLQESQFLHELRMHFRWRKGDFKQRFFNLGTHDHDTFIQKLIDKGYEEVK